MKSEAREIHGRAEQSREQGNFLDALQLSDEALIKYQKENNLFGVCDVLGSKVITLLHLAEETGRVEYIIIAKHLAMAAVEIAEKSDKPSNAMTPYMNLGRVQGKLNEHKDAAESYGKAVEIFETDTPEEHNRPGVLADMKIHKETSAYKAGDKNALERALAALSDLEKSDEVKYNKDVWMSGGYMKLAEMLKSDDLQKATEYLNKAKEVIDANPQLSLRAGQWEKLAAKF